MADWLGHKYPGENVVVSVYLANQSKDIDLWGGKRLFFEWDLGAMEHVGRVLTAEDDTLNPEIYVLVSYGRTDVVRWRRGEKDGWFSIPLPVDMR